MPFENQHKRTFGDITGILNVKDYGAAGDGVEDDTATILATINAAKDYYNPKRVFFPAGKYKISAALTIDRRVELVGVGFGSQIWQSADENLFEFIPYAGATTAGLRIANMYLGSSATSAGTSLIYLHKTGSSLIENIVMRGSYYGVYLHASLHNTVRDVLTQVDGFFESLPSNNSWIYLAPDGGSHSNGNMFINCNINYGEYGLYVDETNEGNFYWYGGRIESSNNFGVYVGYAHGWTIQDIHMEGDVATCGITIEKCTNGRLLGKNYMKLNIKNSNRITILGGTYSTCIIDKYSKDIIMENTHFSSGTTVASAESDVSHVTDAGDDYIAFAGQTSRSIRNLCDGGLEFWDWNSLPIGFGKWGTAAIVAEENSIVKFGTSSAKIEVGGGGIAAAITFDLDYDRYAKLDLTNYRSSVYKWTASGQGTDEYFVELAAGGDPEILEEPVKASASVTGGVLINDTWADKGALGSLAAGEWGYGDSSSENGYNTIYVRLSDGTDPDSKASGYVRAMHKLHSITVSCWAYKPATNGGDPGIWVEYTGAGGGHTGGYKGIPVDEWTRISTTFRIRSGKTDVLAKIGFLATQAVGTLVYVDAIEIVDGNAASPIYDDSRGMVADLRVNHSLIIGRRFITNEFVTMVENDTTPTALNAVNFITNNTVAKTITMFDNGLEGQEIYVKFGDNNTTIDFTGTNLKGNAGVDWSPSQGDHLRAKFDGTDWTCECFDNTA